MFEIAEHAGGDALHAVEAHVSGGFRKARDGRYIGIVGVCAGAGIVRGSRVIRRRELGRQTLELVRQRGEEILSSHRLRFRAFRYAARAVVGSLNTRTDSTRRSADFDRSAVASDCSRISAAVFSVLAPIWCTRLRSSVVIFICTWAEEVMRFTSSTSEAVDCCVSRICAPERAAISDPSTTCEIVLLTVLIVSDGFDLNVVHELRDLLRRLA